MRHGRAAPLRAVAATLLLLWSLPMAEAGAIPGLSAAQGTPADADRAVGSGSGREEDPFPAWPVPRFFMYEGPAFNWTYLLACYPTYGASGSRTAKDDNEVAFAEQLRGSPHRTADAAQAQLYVVPAPLSLSVRAGRCRGRTHQHRVAALAAALRGSPFFRARQGRDHLFFCTDWHIRQFGRERTLAAVMRHAILAYHSAFDANERKGGLVARCLVVAPLRENPLCHRPRAEGLGSRPLNFYFQGAILAWPCSHIRRELPRLGGRNDTLLGDTPRPDVPQAPLQRPVPKRPFSREAAHTAMTRTKFCLIPAGDSPSCSRVYDAVACGCVPVLLSRYLRWDLAFRALLPWADATLAVAEADFAAAPGPALDRLLGTVTAGRYRRLRRGLARLAPHVTYEHPHSSVAHNVLRVAHRNCVAGGTRRCLSAPFSCELRRVPAFAPAANGTGAPEACRPAVLDRPDSRCEPVLGPGTCAL